MRRALPLLLAALLLGGANDYGPDPAEGTSRYTPNGAFGDYLVGRFAMQRGDAATAAQQLEAALTLEPGLPELANQALIAAVLAGRPDAARIAVGLPDNPVARLVLADREAKAGNWAGAARVFDDLPPNGLTQALRPLLVAWAQSGDGRAPVALQTLQTALSAGQNRPVLTLHAALIADLAGRAEEAGGLYEQARREYGVLNIRLGQILASYAYRSGNPAGAEGVVSDMVANSGELALARADLLAAAREPAVRNAADGVAEVYLAMAATLRPSNADSALVLLRLALDMRPDFTPARMLLADMQGEAKRPASALDTLASVPPHDGLVAVVQLRRAALLDELDRTAEATELLEAMAAAHPDRPEPLALLGDLLRRHSRFAESASVYDRAIARIGTPTRTNWPLFYSRGIALERSGQWERAEADFRFALELSPDQPGVLNYLGYAWTERGEHLDQARRMIERAVEQRPDDGSLVDSLGWVLLRLGDKEGALRNLQRAVDLQPEDATINGHLGDALAAVGRLREAEYQWRRALVLQPEPGEAARIEAKLRGLSEKESTATSAPAP